MGGTVSSGADNDELVDNLLEGGRIKSVLVERICRSVDRAFYFLAKDVKHAYKDVAWKRGNTHLSAPCIYSEVMENLDLEPGLSFLNIGSGTGYLSTMVGLVLGSSGINHGVELHEDVISYAQEKLELFKTTSNALDVFDFCEPVFVKGNSLNLKISRQYDRVYCGAECPVTYQPFINELIKVGGILVMPVEDTLMKYKRLDETRWVSTSVLPVSFAPLIIPGPDDKMDSVLLPSVEPLSLQALCRSNIRNSLRNNARKEFPEIDEMNRNRSTKKKKSMRQNRIHPIVSALRISTSPSFPRSCLLSNTSPLSNLSGPIELPSIPSILVRSDARFSGDELSDDSFSFSTSSSFDADYLLRDSSDVVSESDSLSSDSDTALNTSVVQSVEECEQSSGSQTKLSNNRETADLSDVDSSGSENHSLKRRTKRENLEAKRQRMRPSNEESSSSNLSFSSMTTNETNDERPKRPATEELSCLAFSFSSAADEMEVDEQSARPKETIDESSSTDAQNDDSSNSNESFEEKRAKESKKGKSYRIEDSDDGESSEVNEEGASDENEPSESEPAITYSSVMKTKVKELPLPHALKCYLNYYRDF